MVELLHEPVRERERDLLVALGPQVVERVGLGYADEAAYHGLRWDVLGV